MFDFRVMQYKEKNNIDLQGTCISVIVQKQIDSDVSGVGFSINPLNNCYDEAMINASFGLGEAIVSGIVTPDTYIVEKVKMEIIDKSVANKEIAIHLKSDGGIEESKNPNPLQQALSDSQIIELTDLIKKCEDYYKFPVDTEWAYYDGKLFLLQARPITTHVPLYPELMTKPGEPKMIYLDLMGLTQGFTDTMSVMGMDFWAEMLTNIKGEIMISKIDGTTPALHGRQYLNISNMFKGASNKIASSLLNSYDGNVRRIFKDIDIEEYKKGPTPKTLKGMKIGLVKLAVKVLPSIIKSSVSDYRVVIKTFLDEVNEFMYSSDNLTTDKDILENVNNMMSGCSAIMNNSGVIFTGYSASGKFKKMFKGHDVAADLASLSMDLEGNVTSEMGYSMFRMASDSEFKKTTSRDEFMEKINSNSYNSDFMNEYKEFTKRFGARGFMEIDVATPRLWENPSSLYDRLKEINTSEDISKAVKKKRKEAYDRLFAIAEKEGFVKKFKKVAEGLQGTLGYREYPKYVVVYVFGNLHTLLLQYGEKLVKTGQLDSANQVFDLHINQVAEGLKDNKFDLQSLRKSNLEPILKTANVKNWPLVIDSRGKIFKPTIVAEDGDLVGDPIASGKVTGRAKVLHTPYEKSLNEGEILVTKATEPSWTPIFINAAGVVMEIGGPLQHGGVIAREYGIPCVSGLIGAMDIIEDGDLLEVDGSNGIVKILEKANEM